MFCYFLTELIAYVSFNLVTGCTNWDFDFKFTKCQVAFARAVILLVYTFSSV